jgi:glycosyltransferase involved in cell wall biosynthesis
MDFVKLTDNFLIVIKDKSLRQRLAENARKKIFLYDEDSIFSKIFETYKSLIKNNEL